jgi:hypothetical protein
MWLLVIIAIILFVLYEWRKEKASEKHADWMMKNDPEIQKDNATLRGLGFDEYGNPLSKKSK